MSASLAQERNNRLDLAAAVGQPAPPPVLNPRHPDSYVVQRGDTLWDIAAMFLRDPWYWPEIWQINPQVENPHLIYPGDLLSLAYLDDGRPVVNVERGPAFTGGGGVDRLSPRVREQPLEEAISTIPYETLAAFLSRSVVLDKDQIEGSAVRLQASRRPDRELRPRRLRARHRRAGRLRVQPRASRRRARRSG